MTLDKLRFEFRIVDEESGEVVTSDFCALTTIDEFGGCESVEIHTSSALRFVKKELAKPAPAAAEEDETVA